MKPFNKEEYNKLCAEFLGAWIEHKEQPNSYWENLPLSSKIYPQTKDLLFDSDWNWIMEVIEKIETLPDLYGRRDCRYVIDITTDALVNNKHTVSITHSLSSYSPKGNSPIYKQERKVTIYRYDSKKEAVIQAIWQFLNWWYENNNKQNNP